MRDVPEEEKLLKAQVRAVEAVRRGPLRLEDARVIADALDVYEAVGCSRTFNSVMTTRDFHHAAELARGFRSVLAEP